MMSEWRDYYKQWENSNLRETKKIICHSKSNDDSFLKM